MENILGNLTYGIAENLDKTSAAEEIMYSWINVK